MRQGSVQELIREALPRSGESSPRPIAEATFDIAIIGAGFSGIGAAIRLAQEGFRRFTIFEKADDVGGTWRDNTYPGAGCDVPSHLYSFSFERRAHWSRRFPEQPEILEYLHECVELHGLRPHLRLGTEIAAATFDDATGCWHLVTTGGDTHTARAIICGVGQLNLPHRPEIPGRDSFAGTTFHSARWNHAHDLTGERVGVIGNGASAVQFVPPVARQAGHLTVFQRSANWILPKPDGPFSERTKWAFAHVPFLDRLYRARIYAAFESRWAVFRKGSRFGRLMERLLRRYLRDQVPDADLRAKLEPDYPVGCKRILISNDYLATLTRPDVSVVTDAITAVEPTGVRTADGTLHELDTLIWSTGFSTTSFLAPMDIVGRARRKLADAWVDGAQAHLGITVAGFPNLFLLYGPNTNLGHNSIIVMLECQLRYILDCLDELAASQRSWLDVRPDAMARSNERIQAQLHGTVWEAGCDSWYKNDAGRVVNNWCGTTIQYWRETRHPDFSEFTYGPPVSQQQLVETAGASR